MTTISHTLYGCVDWNKSIKLIIKIIEGHTLYGCVDWNLLCLEVGAELLVTPCMGVWIETSKEPSQRAPEKSHTLYGCVDWNKEDVEVDFIICRHTLYGCVDWNSVSLYCIIIQL